VKIHCDNLFCIVKHLRTVSFYFVYDDQIVFSHFEVHIFKFMKIL